MMRAHTGPTAKIHSGAGENHENYSDHVLAKNICLENHENGTNEMFFLGVAYVHAMKRSSRDENRSSTDVILWCLTPRVPLPMALSSLLSEYLLPRPTERSCRIRYSLSPLWGRTTG